MDTKIIKEITTITGRKVKLIVKDANEHQQKCWMNGNFYEAQGGGLLSYMMQNKQRYQGKNALDIGASIGNHTVYFSKVLGCKVTSIEPVPSSFEHLTENCKLNNIKAKLINCALGNKTGKIVMENVSIKTFNVGMYQVRESSIGDVKLDKLDNLLKKQFDFIKIDVEHYNEQLLAGGREFFMSQNKCDVFIECEDKEILGKTNRIMKGFGYKFNLDVKLNHTPTYLWTK